MIHKDSASLAENNSCRQIFQSFVLWSKLKSSIFHKPRLTLQHCLTSTNEPLLIQKISTGKANLLWDKKTDLLSYIKEQSCSSIIRILIDVAVSPAVSKSLNLSVTDLYLHRCCIDCWTVEIYHLQRNMEEIPSGFR